MGKFCGGRKLFCIALWVAFSSSATAAEYEFHFKNAEAQNVSVLGEFNGWKAQAMSKGGDGIWTVRVSLGAGVYGYKFLINGKDWIFDPDNPKRKTVDGIENSLLEIAEGASTPAATARPVATPLLTASRLTSSALGPAPTLSPTPGEIMILEIALSASRKADAIKDGYATVAHARIAVAVPTGFDPQKSWPLLVICNTEAYSNIDSLRQFKDAALAEGWVAVAADAVESDKEKEGGCRWPMMAAAFDYLTAAWPMAKDWPVASGGMSGGGKNGAFLAGDLARDHHRLIGMLMMGCNEDMATVVFRRTAPPSYLNAAVFLSSGKSDAIATPAQHEQVKNSLRATGFNKVRLEAFEGAHDIYQPHIGEALRWFMAESAKGSAKTPTTSDFDKLFKKK